MNRTIARSTRYQPRITEGKEDWELAIDNPDVDDGSFATKAEALEAGIAYCENCFDRRAALKNLVIAKITVTYLKPNFPPKRQRKAK
jgi:hypothetical protein